MENNAKNRKLIAHIAMESMTFEEMEDAIIYEFSERYKREPGLFDAVVQELTDIDMLEGGE
tara:strand:- start:22 stop:204 length:183 start_codon:yes stop_codon:yes gene_type:complete